VRCPRVTSRSWRGESFRTEGGHEKPARGRAGLVVIARNDSLRTQLRIRATQAIEMDVVRAGDQARTEAEVGSSTVTRVLMPLIVELNFISLAPFECPARRQQPMVLADPAVERRVEARKLA
jgi:hypothetical protein